jgi:hypothetical protein
MILPKVRETQITVSSGCGSGCNDICWSVFDV